MDGFRVGIREGESRVLRRATTRPVISNPDVAGTRRAWGRTRWWPGNGGDGDGDGRRGDDGDGEAAAAGSGNGGSGGGLCAG